MKKVIRRTPARRTRDYPGTARQGRCRALLVRPIITIGFGLVLALCSAALTYSAPPSTQASVLFLQTTQTPQAEDLSVIGSTDGIIAMGFLIALIIIIPILLQRKSWMEPR